MTRREPLETRRQECSGHSTIAPSLSVLRARHEADRGRLSARRLELALLLVVVGFSERSRDHLAEWVTPGADRTRTLPSPPHDRRSRRGNAHRLWRRVQPANPPLSRPLPTGGRRFGTFWSIAGAPSGYHALTGLAKRAPRKVAHQPCLVSTSPSAGVTRWPPMLSSVSRVDQHEHSQGVNTATGRTLGPSESRRLDAGARQFCLRKPVVSRRPRWRASVTFLLGNRQVQRE